MSRGWRSRPARWLLVYVTYKSANAKLNWKITSTFLCFCCVYPPRDWDFFLFLCFVLFCFLSITSFSKKNHLFSTIVGLSLVLRFFFFCFYFILFFCSWMATRTAECKADWLVASCGRVTAERMKWSPGAESDALRPEVGGHCSQHGR